MSVGSNVTKDDAQKRLGEWHERSWRDLQEDEDVGSAVMEASYPSSQFLSEEEGIEAVAELHRKDKMSEGDIMTAEEAAAEEKLLGKRGVPHSDSCPVSYSGGMASATCNCGKDSLNDDVPSFLHASAKAGPPLDALGRTPAERKERKIADAIALGEKTTPAILMPGPEDRGPRRTVDIMKDHELQYPDLYLAVYVAPDWDVRDDEARFARLFTRAGCYKAETIEDADLVVFGGGSDVEPSLYGEKNENRHPSTFFNPERDSEDMKIYLQARSQGTPMMGVCRGAQFLHVMNGGQLFQDIDGHVGEHRGWALREKLLIEKVSSVHHQSCIWNKEGGMEILMTTANGSTVRWLNKDEKYTKPAMDIEAFFYRDTGCFGVQGHPEYSGCNRYSVWCLEKLSDLFLNSPDFEWSGKRLQMTKEARDAEAIAAQYVENAYNQSKEA